MEESGGVAALERALKILGCFRPDDRGLSLAELAQRTGLYKSTILRLCASLEKFGYVLRLADGRFVLGGATFRLGQTYQLSFDLAEFVGPVLRCLAAATGLSASFWIAEGASRVCLYRTAFAAGQRDVSALVGESCPLDQGGSASTVLRAFSGAKGKRFDSARRNRVVVSLGEFIAELAAVSSPVFSDDERLVGALSLGGFRSQFTKEAIMKLKPQVLAAATEISASLGAASVPDEVSATSIRSREAAAYARTRASSRQRRT